MRLVTALPVRGATFLILGLAAASCSVPSYDAVAREAARSAITPVVVERFPGVPVEPALNCVIDNATGTQIRALAADSVAGPTASTVEVVSDVMSKPETLRCLGANGLPALTIGR